MSRRTTVGVIGGGANCEHEVSLASADSVAKAVGDRYDVVRLTIDRHGEWRDRGDRPIGLNGALFALRGCDVVLPVVHGPHGEDGTLAALCDLARLPYVGSGVGAGALAMDKWATKLVAEAVGVHTAPGVLLTPATAATYRWTKPVVVKPVAAGSSHGVTLVTSRTGMSAALETAFALDGRVLVEDLVVGREIDVAVVRRPDGHLVSPSLEVLGDGLFDNETKYGGGASFEIPADLAAWPARELERAAVLVFEALGCRGLARVDFFLTDTGWVLNEVNTMPGFTAESQVPRMFAVAGLAYPDLLDLLISDALDARRDGTSMVRFSA
jgi:D-alanine-D-alanine ligase